jgi:hypothetical protein
MLNRQKNSAVNRRHDDVQTGGVLLVRCEEEGGACTEFCRLACDKDAIAFAAGDVLVDTGLCTGCAERGGEPLPACIGRCTVAPQKTLHTASTDEKRRRAAEALI